jgi:restriction endonuclease BglII
MQPTQTYLKVFPSSVLERYDFLEVRGASIVLKATNPTEFEDLTQVLKEFSVDVDLDIFPPGGNESETASRLNHAFRTLGWREAQYKVSISSELILRAPGSPAESLTVDNESSSYLVDNVKGRVALDVEWHAKDGNLDRDIAAWRTLYDSGIIDGAIMITMTRESMRKWAVSLNPSTKKFQTTTTTNLEKVTSRLTRGSGGGCPILIVSICERTV